MSGTSTPTLPASLDEWLAALASGPGEIGTLLRPSRAEQVERGYGHTLREIGQQPVTWIETAARMSGLVPLFEASLDGATSVVFTGSGSSVYAGECVAPCLQQTLGVPVTAIPAGLILTHPETCLPPNGPFLVVSLARSGNSPESRAVVDWLLESRPLARHLFITCNSRGALATSYRERPEVRVVVLDEKTDDRSLVMTSSFTNLALAGRALGSRRDPASCEAQALGLARGAASLLRHEADGLARVARSTFDSVAYLGSGCRLGSAREAALKMLEMNSGEVWTLAESYLGFRHGPMSALRPGTLLVAFLSSDPLVRAYEIDLLRELDRKGLATRRVVFGAGLPSKLSSDPGALLVDGSVGVACQDEDLTLLDAVVGQLLAFFRCLAAGHRPDSPSEGSVITRVVSGFEIHRRNGSR
ncbi:MAG TPA: tagatose-6-phosphate ketose isomerase [Vicinamibacteria bacterium]|nr:tagatose-6-phosphate ketose isomerase [Vicinamibacteria bacterium]